MPAIERQLERWKLLPASQQLTEFYLEDIDSLPNMYTPGQPLGATFAVVNRTSTLRTYEYRAVQTDSTGRNTTELLRNSIEVGPGYTASIDISLVPLDFGERSDIRIELVGTDLATNFWVAKE